MTRIGKVKHMKPNYRSALIVIMTLVVLFSAACSRNTPTEVPSGSEQNSEAESGEMIIPEFFNYYFELKDRSYELALSTDGTKWEEIQPYGVRVNPNMTQNVRIDEPVQISPMIYFDMGDSPVKVRITKKDVRINKASVHPLSFGMDAEIKDGAAYITIDKPSKLCVRINDERYDMVYIFANPKESAVPEEGDDGVRIIKPGLTSAPKVGTETWGGGIRDVRVYDRVLTPDEISNLAGGTDIAGFTDRWELTGDLVNEMKPEVTPVSYGEPEVIEGYEGSDGALVLNGYGDAVMTGKVLRTGDPAYTVSAWAYMEPEAEGAHRVIINHLLFVRSDGTVGSNLGDWQFPYVSENKFSSGGWHNVILTKNGEEVTVYIDGESGGTQHRKNQDLSVNIGIGTGTIINAIYVKDNETLYISPGAVVRGTVMIYGSENASVRGRGVIDVTPNNTVQSYSGIVCAYSENIKIEGVIVNNPSSFNLAIGQSSNVSVENFKCFSSYGAADGINTKASSNISIDDCFLRSNDDTISIYATSVSYLGSTGDLTVRNSTLISDAGHIVNSGTHAQEYDEETISNILIENVDVIDSKSNYPEYQGVLSVNAGNDVIAKDFVFSDIRIEDFRINQLFNLRVIYNPGYNKTPGRSVENILFRNITYNGQNAAPSIIKGYNSTRTVKGIVFENVMINGTKMTEGDGNIVDSGFASDIVIK